VQSPATEYKHQQKNKAEQANATARLTPPKDRAVFGVAVSFFVMVFAADTLALLYFLQMKSVIDKMYLQKINKCSQQHEAKTHAKKNCLKLH